MFYTADASCEGILTGQRFRLNLNVVTDSTTYAMDSSSSYGVVFDGTASGSARLPNATGLDLGHVFYIMNNSVNSVGVEDSDGTDLHKIPTFSSAKATLVANGDSNGEWFIDHPAQCDQEQIIWVGKHGNNLNDGKSICEAKLTFEGAITAAEALSPSDDTRAVVTCVDNGRYLENVVLDTEYINVNARAATIAGSVKIGDNNEVYLGAIDCTQGHALEKDTGSALSYAVIGRMESNGSHGIINTSSGGLNVEVEIFSQYGQFGIGDSSASMGITHADIQDFDIWNDGTGVARGSAGYSTLRTGFMTERSGNCLGIYCSDGYVLATAARISANTAYQSTSNGVINLVSADIDGDKLREGSSIAYVTWGGHISQTPVFQDSLGAADDGKVLRYNHADGEIQWKTNLEGSTFWACQLDNPVTSDWAVNELAPVAADSNNSGLLVRRFDDSDEEGVGCIIDIPVDASNMSIGFFSRAETAPGSTVGVAVNMYERGIPDNGAVEAWSSEYNLNFIEFSTNENFQHDSTTIALSTLGLTAGQVHQLEFTRDYDASFDTLSGDWSLLKLSLSFS